MTTYLDDPFTASNGTAWSSGSWVAGSQTSGASATVQSNFGRLNSGSVTGYSGKASRAANAVSVSAGRIRLYGVTFRGSVDGALAVILRGDTDLDFVDGYYLMLDRGAQEIRLVRWDGGGDSVIGTAQSYTIAQDVPHEVDFYVNGSSIKAWIWPSAGGKPSTPTYDLTNSDISGPGSVGLVAVGGSAANGQIDIDRAQITDGSGDLLITSSITASGALLKTPRKIFTSSVTASGALTRIKVIVRILTASITATGSLLRGRLRVFAGSITPSGLVGKQPRKILTASIAASGALRKGLLRTLTGSITASGNLVANYLGRLVGGSATVRMTASAVSWVRITTRRWLS